MQNPNFETLSQRKTKFEESLATRRNMLSYELDRLESMKAQVVSNKRDIEDFEAAVDLCRACLQEQAEAKAYAENIVTALLDGVMRGVHDYYELSGEAPEYKFSFDYVTDDTGTIVGFKPMIYKNGVGDDPSNYGGGVQNLASFALRLVYLLLNPSLSQVLIMDEPMTNLSPKAWKFVVRFLQDLQADLSLQVIAITHSGAQFPRTWTVWREGQTSYVKLETPDE